MCEAGLFGSMNTRGKYSERLAPVLRRAHRDFLLWKKLNKKQCSQPRFTPARCSRAVQTSFLAFVGTCKFFVLRVAGWSFVYVPDAYDQQRGLEAFHVCKAKLRLQRF